MVILYGTERVRMLWLPLLSIDVKNGTLFDGKNGTLYANDGHMNEEIKCFVVRTQQNK